MYVTWSSVYGSVREGKAVKVTASGLFEDTR
jgi:hypothetical protein